MTVPEPTIHPSFNWCSTHFLITSKAYVEIYSRLGTFPLNTQLTKRYTCLEVIFCHTTCLLGALKPLTPPHAILHTFACKVHFPQLFSYAPYPAVPRILHTILHRSLSTSSHKITIDLSHAKSSPCIFLQLLQDLNSHIKTKSSLNLNFLPTHQNL